MNKMSDKDFAFRCIAEILAYIDKHEDDIVDILNERYETFPEYLTHNIRFTKFHDLNRDRTYDKDFMLEFTHKFQLIIDYYFKDIILHKEILGLLNDKPMSFDERYLKNK